jgi:hypothetical protein
MSPNSCLNSFYHLGDPVMDWECWLSGSSSFQFCSCLADGPRAQCSSHVLRVLARLRFRSVLDSSFGWKWFRTVRSSGRAVRGCLADSPRAPRGRSVFWGSLLEVLLALMDSPRPRPDGPPYLCGQSAWPERKVRPTWLDGPPELGCFALWFDSSLLLSCFYVCFKESFLRLEVDP